MKSTFSVIGIFGGLLAGCGAEAPDKAPAAAVEVPEKLRPVGAGYPSAGSPCRRLGESPATSNYLDHTAILVGCPGTRESAIVQAVVAAGGRIVAEIEGVVLLSVPTDNPG